MFFSVAAVDGKDYYAAPVAPVDGDGSFTRPMPLEKALLGEALRSGDTLWLRGGVYRGTFISRLKGSEGAPVMVRSYDKEQVRIAGNGASQDVLLVAEPWVSFFGIEVENSATETAGTPGAAIVVAASHTQLINLLVHDASVGMVIRPGLEDVELYGNIVYRNGVLGADGAGSAGILAAAGTKIRIASNVVFHQRVRGILVNRQPGESGGDISIENNILLDNGAEAAGTIPGNLQLRGVFEGQARITGNYTFESRFWNGGENVLAETGCGEMNVHNNYLVGRIALTLVACAGTVLEGNTVLGGTQGTDIGLFPNNFYQQAKPAESRIFLSKNDYDTGRANLVVYNWGAARSISADLSSILTTGQKYEIREVRNLSGEPVATSIYNGSPVELSLLASDGTNGQTELEFGAFVVTVEGTAAENTESIAGDASATPTSSQTAKRAESESNNPAAATQQYLSDRAWITATNGWGPVEKDRPNGDQEIGDGAAQLKLNGVTYTKGLGVHASSNIRYSITGCTSFTTQMGVDDEVGSSGSVIFQIWVDNAKAYDSGVMTGSTATKTATVSLSGKSELRLMITDAGDNMHFDHADWAGAVLTCGSDTTAPTVTSKSPAAAATGVALKPSVTATFSEAMQGSSLTLATMTLMKQGTTAVVASTMNYNGTTKTVTLTPSAALNENTSYTVTIKGGANGAKDLAGNPLAANYSWSFTTADTTAPKVTGTSPSTAATGVSAGATISATFSKEMQSGSLTAGTVTLVKQGTATAVPAAVNYNGSTKMVTLMPAAALSGSTSYTVAIKGGTNGAKDVAGNSLAANYSWSFTTADTTAPKVTGTSPSAAATGVAANATVSATFSKEMQSGSLTASTVTLVKQGTTTAVPATVSYNSGSKAVTLTPAAALSGSTSYTVTIKGGTGGAKDTAGNLLAANYSWSFTTGDTTAPNVTGTSPSAGATGIATNAAISATFSEGMQSGSLTAGTITLVKQGTTTAVPAAVSYNSGSKAVILTPSAPLSAGTTYTATVKGGAAGAKDQAGNALTANVSWSFTTAAPVTNTPAPSSPITSAPTTSTSYLSDSTWTASTNGWGPVERDRANGDEATGDGARLTLNGTAYAKGLGVHANSEIRYPVSGCSSFTSDIGVDDEVGSKGSIVFQIWLDGTKAYDSGTMTGSTATKRANVSLSGKSEMRLVVTNAGDGSDFDHGDWAGATIVCQATQQSASKGPAGSVSISPGTTIQTVVDQYPDGTVFYLRTGVHRMQFVQPKSGNAFVGESGAILSGARLLTSFSREGSYWVATGQTQQTDVNAGHLCDSTHPRCRYPEDFFIDGTALLHVANKSDVSAGKYYFDYAADKIYFADDPTGHQVEASVTAYAFRSPGQNVRIEGLTVEKYANTAQTGAIQPGGWGWIIKNNVVQRNHGGGIDLNSKVQVLNNKVLYNGQIGIHGSGEGIVVDGNEIAFNNQLGYDYGWEAGGTKFAFCENLTVKNNNVHDNKGPGLWTDINNYKVLYEGNRVTNNVIGIFHEISYDAVIRNNVIENNGLMLPSNQRELWWTSGILITASQNVEVYGNTLRGNVNGIGAVQTNRGTGNRGTYETRNVYVHNNTIQQSSGMASGMVTSPGYDRLFTEWNNRYADNTYVLPNADQAIYGWAGRLLNRTQWKTYGHDVNGRW